MFGLGSFAARSIPACAGEPEPGRPYPPWVRVYPRVCGGTAAVSVVSMSDSGLSPRVRGNHNLGTAAYPSMGSIPACAGEPGAANSPVRRVKVYPRVCGGTLGVRSPPAHGDGLSPACAGEPRDRCRAWRRRGVYPRVCGGTKVMIGKLLSKPGLSPRVRGNRNHARIEAVEHGSIPACAGEPRFQRASTAYAKVYPRVCGGNLWEGQIIELAEGLSPRVRGNPPEPWSLLKR